MGDVQAAYRVVAISRFKLLMNVGPSRSAAAILSLRSLCRAHNGEKPLLDVALSSSALEKQLLMGMLAS